MGIRRTALNYSPPPPRFLSTSTSAHDPARLAQFVRGGRVSIIHVDPGASLLRKLRRSENNFNLLTAKLNIGIWKSVLISLQTSFRSTCRAVNEIDFAICTPD